MRFLFIVSCSSCSITIPNRIFNIPFLVAWCQGSLATSDPCRASSCSCGSCFGIPSSGQIFRMIDRGFGIFLMKHLASRWFFRLGQNLRKHPSSFPMIQLWDVWQLTKSSRWRNWSWGYQISKSVKLRSFCCCFFLAAFDSESIPKNSLQKSGFQVSDRLVVAGCVDPFPKKWSC